MPLYGGLESTWNQEEAMDPLKFAKTDEHNLQVVQFGIQRKSWSSILDLKYGGGKDFFSSEQEASQGKKQATC